MKAIQKYVCEVCHTEYADKRDADACEKNHKIPASVVCARHQPKSQNGHGYPVTVTVRMSDGTDIIYKR